jgi:hypothetical protein
MKSESRRIIEEAVEAASLYTQAEVDHFKLRMVKAITTWMSKLVSGLVGMLTVVLVLFFLGLAAAMFLQAYVSPGQAYLIVGLGYALICTVFIAFRKKLIAPFILRSALNEMFDES